MGMPRKQYVKEGQEAFFHCFSRCVRRAFLFGIDTLTGRDFSHRKIWFLNRLRFLASLFAIDVCAYAILSNHYHLVLHVIPQIAARWSNREVATRWLTLFPHHDPLTREPLPPSESQITAILNNPKRIKKLRKRLANLSWFMAQLNEHIARLANKEDNLSGRYWESRFKCTALLDEPALIAAMAYVDLNPIRAGLATTPENSDFSSIQERIKAALNDIQSDDCSTPISWLSPIPSSQPGGILNISEIEYLNLVNSSACLLHPYKSPSSDFLLAPTLKRIGLKPEAWINNISHFTSRFHIAAGLVTSLRNFASQIGRRWVVGISAARTSFDLPLQPHG